MPYPVVPEYITVHLGAPDAPVRNDRFLGGCGV